MKPSTTPMSATMTSIESWYADASLWEVWYTLSVYVVLPLFFVWFYKMYRDTSPERYGIRSPKPNHFLLGHMVTLAKNYHVRNHLLFTERQISMARSGGTTSTFAFHLPLVPYMYVVTSSVENTKYILKDNWENFPKGPLVHSVLEDLLGDGIFAVDGKAWLSQRKTATHMLTQRALRDSMMPTFLEHCEALSHLLDATIKAGKDVVLSDVIYRFTLESICSVSFGVKLGGLTPENPNGAFQASFDLSQRLMETRFVRMPVLWKTERWLNLPFTVEGRLSRAFGYVKEFSQKIIEERAQMDPDQLDQRCDLLSMFVRQGSDERGRPLTQKYLRDVMMNFIIAGRDTTAQACSWLFFELMRHAPELEKLVAEVDQTSAVTYENQNDDEFAYLEACILETLRLYPSVPVEIKQCVNKCTLPDGTNMPDNSYVLLSFWNMGRAEDIWGPDASEWRPERWTEMKERPSDYKFPAFQAGRRACLGKRMAMLELKVLVHHLLYNYKFEASADQKPVEYEVSMTLPMRHPLLAKASKRNKH